jgi:predicted GNAT family N-acyltransferase
MAADHTPPFALRVVDWARGEAALRAVRIAVFVIEQNIPEELEWDEHDAASTHAIAEDESGTPVGCGRLLPDGHIGRLAVLSDWRGRGVGAAILDRLIAVARARGDARVLLNAQVQAMQFYARYGFEPVGEVFAEAGIPHQTMERFLR